MTHGLQTRRDANEALFLARQLEFITGKVYERKYADLKCRIHFPVSFEGGPGAESITYRFLDRVGVAQIGYNFPRVQVRATEHTVKIKPLTASYEFTFQEARYAMQAGVPMDTQLAMAAKRAIAERENSIAYLGDAESGLVGAFSHPNVGVQVAANPISSASTPDQIIAVVNSAINGIKSLSRGIEQPNTVLVTVAALTHMATTPRSANTDTTILGFLENAHPQIEFDWCNECSGAGTNGRDVMFVYVRNEDNLVLRIPQDFEQLTPFWNGSSTLVNCHERIGGVQMFYASALIVEGI